MPNSTNRLVYYYKNGQYYVGSFTEKNLANQYDATSTYAVGDLAIYLGVLYQCSSAITVAEAFDPTHWTVVKLADVVETKQDTLVSGTNIKTINNTSLLGSGNITIQSGVTSVGGATGAITLGTGLSISGNEISAQSITVDSAISTTSTNPVQNKVITSAITTHASDTTNPHSVTKTQVGLGSVVNTGDSATPVENGTDKFTTGGAYVLQQSIATASTKASKVVISGTEYTATWDPTTGTLTLA